jgi:4,5-DOPA dioxygenase extradiol
LRQEGFLVIGSGNIVHNLRLVYSREDNSPYDWAIEFDAWVKDRIDQRDFASLIHYEKMGTAAHLSVPTVDHYAPLIYALALAEESEEIIFTYEEVFTSMSMRCLQIG